MARPVILSNGELHVGINKYGLVHDFYFPYVGLENHSSGKSTRHRVGIWAEGHISWLDEPDWKLGFRYPHYSLVGHTIAKNESLGILIEFDDAVDSHMSAFMRNLHVVNLRNDRRDIRLFMHQAFVVGDARSNTDTAQYLPDSDAILHYRGRRAFIVSGMHDNKPFDQHSIGLFGIEGHEGTYRDADDGELSFGNVEHGRVDSVIRFRLDIAAHSSARVHYWVAAGTSIREALYIHKQIREEGLLSRIQSTVQWWRKWLQPAMEVAQKLPVKHRDQFIKSVMIIKAQTDKRGAVIASTDTTMLNYSRDAYAYCWPRDGAYVLWPLIRMGYVDEPRRFFEFCRRGMHPSGYLMHKYRADGALGSSWHPYVHEDGEVAPPIQEDETALVLFVFAQFYQLHPSPQLLRDFYKSMVVPMADFMASYIDETTGLPRPSYDLWEEVFLTTTYSTSVVYAALLAAADIAEAAEDADSAVKWRTAAEDMQAAARKHLYNTDTKSFIKGLIIKDGQIHKNTTYDLSSTFGVFMFGLYPASSDEVISSINTLHERFSDGTDTLKLPRYENDNYRRTNPLVTGNWWGITTLWMAQYNIEQGDIAAAERALDWIKSLAGGTGVLPEQIDPITGEFVSVAPLNWTHAEYITTLLDLADRNGQ